jgi:ribonuclease HI
MDVIAFVSGKTGQSNPGNICIRGIFAHRNSNILREFNEAAGEGTNFQASYLAILKAIELALELTPDKLFIVSSDNLVIKQLTDECVTRNKELLELKGKVNKAEGNLGCKVIYKWVAKHKMPEFNEMRV